MTLTLFRPYDEVKHNRWCAFKVFDIMYITTQGGPGRSTQVLVYHIYNKAFISQEYGYASALATVLFAIVLVITLIQVRLQDGNDA